VCCSVLQLLQRCAPATMVFPSFLLQECVPRLGVTISVCCNLLQCGVVLCSVLQCVEV